MGQVFLLPLRLPSHTPFTLISYPGFTSVKFILTSRLCSAFTYLLPYASLTPFSKIGSDRIQLSYSSTQVVNHYAIPY